MDFLNLLVQRNFGHIDAVEPPRIPYVSVIPEYVREDEGAATEEPQEDISPRASNNEAPKLENVAAPPYDAKDLQQSRAKSDSDATPITIVQTRSPQLELSEPNVPSLLPQTPQISAEARSEVNLASSQSSSVTPEKSQSEAPARLKEVIISRHETTQVSEVQHVQRITERTVEHDVVEPSPPQEGPPAPGRREETKPSFIHARPQQEPLIKPAAVAPPAAPAVAPSQPQPVHVSIGRVTVAVQAPKPPITRTERTRPASPAMDLDAYNARVRKPR